MTAGRGREQGAVLVIATFLAVFLVALVYLVTGAGGAALEQELVQQGADAVAFSAATAYARGMNLLALINLIMAAVLAVLVAVKVLQAILATAIAAVGVACIVSSGAACGAMAPLGQALDKVTEIADEVEPRVKDALEALEKVADEINEITPLVAEAEAVTLAADGTYAPVRIGIAWPVADGLPTRKGTFEELCRKAGENVGETSALLLPGGMPEIATETVGGLVGEVAASFSSYFCGGGDGERPAASRSQEVAYPLSNHESCDAADARPDPATGDCRTAACRQCARFGCSSCLGLQEASRYRRGQWTVRRTVTLRWATAGGQVEERREGAAEQELVWREEDPCAGAGRCDDEPICVTESESPAARPDLPLDAVAVTREEWVRLHGCLTRQEIATPVEGEPLDDLARPREPDPELFPEAPRLTGWVLGGSGAGERLRRVGLGTSPASAPPPGRIGFAAAEYFCRRAATPAETGDLWQMDWRARLIRFRRSSSSAPGGCDGAFAAVCGQVAAGLTGFEIPADLERYLVH